MTKQSIVFVSLMQFIAICYTCLTAGMTLKIYEGVWGRPFFPDLTLIFYYGFLVFLFIPILYAATTAYLSFRASFNVPGWIQTGAGIAIVLYFAYSGCMILVHMFGAY